MARRRPKRNDIPLAKLQGKTERTEDEDDDEYEDEDENRTRTTRIGREKHQTPYYDTEPGSCSPRQTDQLQGMAARSSASLFDE